MGAEGGPSCGCQHAREQAEGNVPPLAPSAGGIAIERTDVRVLRALATEEPLGEPLLAIAEDGSGPARLYPCGPGGCTPDRDARDPQYLAVVRYRTQTDGTLLLVGEDAVPLEPTLSQAMGRPLRKKDNACVPWLRTVRDPKNFRACMNAAYKLGAIDSAKKVFEIFHHELGELEDQEVFAVLMLDGHLMARGRSVIHRGSRDRAEVSIPDTLRIPIHEGATSVIVVHNHPSGRVAPSDSDKSLTKSLRAAFDIVRIPLMDHVIIGRDHYFSFVEHKLL